MRRWQNLLALFAVLLASAALLPLRPGIRLGCIAAAVGVILAVLAMRLRAHQPSSRGAADSDVYDRIARIRAERERRTRR